MDCASGMRSMPRGSGVVSVGHMQRCCARASRKALSGIPALLSAARGYTVRGSVGTGVLYAALPAAEADAVTPLRGAATRAGGHAVVLTAPPPVRDRLDLWGPVEGLALMRRVKAQFDPEGRLAPGRFVGGI